MNTLLALLHAFCTISAIYVCQIFENKLNYCKLIASHHNLRSTLLLLLLPKMYKSRTRCLSIYDENFHASGMGVFMISSLHGDGVGGYFSIQGFAVCVTRALAVEVLASIPLAVLRIKCIFYIRLYWIALGL